MDYSSRLVIPSLLLPSIAVDLARSPELPLTAEGFEERLQYVRNDLNLQRNLSFQLVQPL